MSAKLRAIPAPVRAVLLVGVLLASIFSAAQIAQAVVTDQVRRDTPIVLDGEVWSVEEVGNTIVVGGNFTQVQTSRGGPIVNQAAIFAYDRDSGVFLEDFRPTIFRSVEIPSELPEVLDIEATPDGTGVYIAGRFDGIADSGDARVRVRNRIALLDLDTGRVDRNFALAGVNAAVASIDVDAFGRLYAGGNFDIAFDLAPGRSPIEEQTRGIARFDGETGAFDKTFRYESRVDIGLFGESGVNKVVFANDGRQLYIAHRGAELHNTTTGEVFDSPGVARISVAANSHQGQQYKLLHPDANDPIQEFYHAGACGGAGIQIRDMDVSNGFITLVHQGADRGVQCDTAVRFPSQLGEHRPDWVSRAFDSIFSVEIDGDDVYIGGHFRYLVNDTAPSAYPGRSNANGSTDFGGRSQHYSANPEIDPNFRTELVEPGYVFPVGQIGVLDANTGFANPDFIPQSDANLGVLEITAIERGLLIGQDTGRVNFIETGRSAFFDNDAAAGETSCNVELSDEAIPVISWNNVGDVSRWSLRTNGTFLAVADGPASSFAHTDAAPEQVITYELRYNRNGLSFTDECGSVQTPPAPQLALGCTVEVDANEQVVINWNDEGWSRVAVRADDSFLANVDGGPSVFRGDTRVGTTTYSLRAFADGERFDATCGSVDVGVAAPVCTAAVDGDQVTLAWNDEGWSRVAVRANDVFAADIDGGTSTFTATAPVGTTEYSLRAFIDGQRFDATCEPVVVVAAPTVTALVCETSVNAAGSLVLTWNDVGSSAYVVRTNDSFTATLDAGVTRFETENNGDEIAIRYRLNGQTFTTTCA